MASMNAFAHGSSSDSEEDDDFLHPSNDPNAEEFADYNPRKRRRTGRDAKESAALGIFGSESEDEGPNGRWKKKTLRGKGMAFVSTGQKKLDEDEEDEEELGDEDADMDGIEEEETTVPRGLGFGAEGLGFSSPAPARSKYAPNIRTPLGKGFVPSSAAVPILQNNDDDKVSTPRISRPSAFSTPASGKGAKAASSGPAINASSFAARMMAKMGYKEGQGLGKEGTGRSGVIEVVQRPQGVGLGAVREKSKQEIEEEKRQAKIRGEKYEDSDEERKKKRRKPKTSGNDSGMSEVSTPRRVPKPKFRTLEEVQRAAPGLEIPDVFAPILDMSGPGQRLLTSTSGLLTPTGKTEGKTESVEQVENRKLARRAQNELSAHVEEWKNLDERKAYVEMEILQEQQAIDQLQTEMDQFKIFVDATQNIIQASKESQWDPIIEALLEADKLQVSDVDGELSDTAVAAVHPFLSRATEGWQPLNDPKLNGITTQLPKIRHILGAAARNSKKWKSLNGSHRKNKPTTAYESMIYKIIFPKIVSTINQSWNVHDPAPLLALLEAWDGLLPAFVRSLLIDQALVGKLNEAVSSWNPRKKRSNELPHLWLFPWLQYLPSHHADPKSSTGLVSDVKRKFRHLVDSWDFNKGVVPGLQKWREVLCPNSSNDHWTPLIMNHVLPSMSRFLKNERNFMVDPNDQAPYLPALQGIFAWQDILKPRIVGQVIVETVFPLWQNILHQWLTVVGPNEEIGQWFEWWRDEVFPEALKNLPSIQAEFTKGHDMINAALDLGSKASTLPLPLQPQPHHQTPLPPLPPTKPIPTQGQPPSLRQKIESWCLENDLQFLPEKKVLHPSGPLYRITAAGHGKNGTLVFFRGEEGVMALSKRGQEQVEIPILWEDGSAGNDARDVLLGMAWFGVK